MGALGTLGRFKCCLLDQYTSNNSLIEIDVFHLSPRIKAYTCMCQNESIHVTKCNKKVDF